MNAGDSPFTAVAAGTSPRQVAPGMVIGAKRVFAEPSVPPPWEHGEIGGGSGTVTGPASSTDNALARFDGAASPGREAVAVNPYQSMPVRELRAWPPSEEAVKALEVEIWELKQERLALKERLRNAEGFAARTHDELMSRNGENASLRLDNGEADLVRLALESEITHLRHRVQDLEEREFQRRSKAAKRAARTRKVKQRAGKKAG